jgi:hypothetical protein
MKIRIPKRQSGTPSAEVILAQWCEAFDHSIPRLRTALIIAGVIAAALQTGRLADFLFVTGLLVHWAIWFENWWRSLRSR